MSARRFAAAGARARLGGKHRRQPIEELAHAGRQHLFEPRERVGQVPLERRAGHRLEQVAAEIERADLRQREPGFEAVEHLAVDAPSHAPVVVALVVEREAGLLQRREVAPDRAGRDVELVGKRVDRRAVARRFQRVQHLPLPDDLLVARHRVILAGHRLRFIHGAADTAAVPADGSEVGGEDPDRRRVGLRAEVGRFPVSRVPGWQRDRAAVQVGPAPGSVLSRAGRRPQGAGRGAFRSSTARS